MFAFSKQWLLQFVKIYSTVRTSNGDQLGKLLATLRIHFKLSFREFLFSVHQCLLYYFMFICCRSFSVRVCNPEAYLFYLWTTIFRLLDFISCRCNLSSSKESTDVITTSLLIESNADPTGDSIYRSICS